MIKEMSVMKKNISNTVLLLSLLLLSSVQASAQEKTMIKPYIQLQYLKNTDDRRILQTTLTYSLNRMELPLPGMEISFFEGAGKGLITKIITDTKGIARLELGSDIKLTTDNTGMWTFGSEYKGNDSIEAASSELSVKDVKLLMTLNEVDSIKTISVSAFTGGNGKDKPVAGEVVKIYVPRMFSLLPLGEITLDESGGGTLEFPKDLPGNKEGNLTIIAKFEENEKFGNVEKRSEIKWGTPTDYSVPTSHRALWTKTAPRWMIYTLSVLLTGVWGHYMFAIISLIRIRRDARKKETEEYRS
jgi:hypothetical protein